MKKEKQLFLEDIKSHVVANPSFIVAQYKKLTANQANEFRRQMQKQGVQFEVIRKRMLAKACSLAGFTLPLDVLEGHVGVLSTTNDPMDAVKAVLKYSDANEKCFNLLAARLEGQMILGEDVEALSKIPSKDELRAQFLGLLEAPMSQTLAVFEALLSSVVSCVDNKVKKEQGENV